MPSVNTPVIPPVLPLHFKLVLRNPVVEIAPQTVVLVLFAPEVEDMMRAFPANLVNGEPLLISIDPRNPSGKTKPQPCRLVEVPGV
jgi:hypothetical protein